MRPLHRCYFHPSASMQQLGGTGENGRVELTDAYLRYQMIRYRMV